MWRIMARWLSEAARDRAPRPARRRSTYASADSRNGAETEVLDDVAEHDGRRVGGATYQDVDPAPEFQRIVGLRGNPGVDFAIDDVAHRLVLRRIGYHH